MKRVCQANPRKVQEAAFGIIRMRIRDVAIRSGQFVGIEHTPLPEPCVLRNRTFVAHTIGQNDPANVHGPCSGTRLTTAENREPNLGHGISIRDNGCPTRLRIVVRIQVAPEAGHLLLIYPKTGMRGALPALSDFHRSRRSRHDRSSRVG